MAVRSLADYAFTDRVMRDGDLSRVDVGCSQDYYSGDVGRTVPVSGRFRPEQREAWDLFVDAYHIARKVISPDRTPADVKAAWQAHIASQARAVQSPLARRLVDAATQLPEATRFWQVHHVGLDSAEGIPETFRAGQVVALEPMVSVDGTGFYLEDMLLVTARGTEVLSTNLPYALLGRADRAGHAAPALTFICFDLLPANPRPSMNPYLW
jgi:Xaa-Pro aminopeptidase